MNRIEFGDFYKKYPNEKNEYYYQNFPELSKACIRIRLSKLREIELNKEFEEGMPKIWLFIINQKNWDIVKKTNIIGSKYGTKMSLIKKNDIIIIYIKMLSSIAGEYKVILNYKDEKEHFHGDIYPFRLKLELIKILKNPISIRSLINRLEFIRNKKSWYTHLYGGWGIKQLSLKDYKIIKKEILKIDLIIFGA